MNLIRDLSELPDELRGGAVSIGNFDGVHRGHARIVERLVAMARRLGGPAVVFTFDPPPIQILHPDTAPMPLGWLQRNARLLAEQGADAVIAHPTDREFLQLEARAFFDQIVRDRLAARGLIEGENFLFGRRRGGNIDLLRQFCDESGIPLEVVETLRVDSVVVSSSRVRELICAGRVAEATALLGRPHRIRGRVIRGAGRGARLGFPTANLQQPDTLLPAEGIYAAVGLVGGTPWPAATSVGSNPTFAEQALKVEPHLLGFDGSLYGQVIELDFLVRLRDIVRFDRVEDLVCQMDRDAARTRQIVEQYYSEQYYCEQGGIGLKEPECAASPPESPGTRPDWTRFVEIVESHERFVLTSHVRPDCDALGSELAMAAILERLGKQVRIVNAAAVPPKYRFLDPKRKIQQLGVDVSLQEAASADVLILLDTMARGQLGPMAEVVRTTSAVKVALDHHVSGDDLGAELLKDTSAEATGRLVVEAADALDVALTPEIALPLFAAVATDTGWFRFGSTTAATHRLAARLMDAGAVPEQLYQQLYENDTLPRLRLIGCAMGRVQTERQGRLVHTYLERRDFEATGAHPADSEDIVNMTLSVGGTEVAVLLTEQPGARFRVSFRSRCDFDCARLAQQFGGGGHRKAAGASLEGPLMFVRTTVLDAVRAAME